MATGSASPVEPAAYNTQDAATYLGATPNTMRYWRRRGYGPTYYLMGRNVMYTRVALDAFIAELQAGATRAS